MTEISFEDVRVGDRVVLARRAGPITDGAVAMVEGTISRITDAAVYLGVTQQEYTREGFPRVALLGRDWGTS